MREVDVGGSKVGPDSKLHVFLPRKLHHPSSVSGLKIKVTSVKGAEPGGDKLVIRPQRWKYMPEALNHNPLAHRVQIET